MMTIDWLRRFVSVWALLIPLHAWSDVSLEVDALSGNQLEIQLSESGEVEIDTTGTDPYLSLRPFSRSAVSPEDCVLAFEYFCPDGIDDFEVFYGPPIRAGQSVSGGGLTKSESWVAASIDLKQLSAGRWEREFNLFRLDFGRLSGVRLQMRALRLRAPNADERMAAGEIERIRREKSNRANTILEYLDHEYPARIDSLTVIRDSILLDGRVRVRDGRDIYLVEAPWHGVSFGGDSMTLQSQGGTATVKVDPVDGVFSLRLPRVVDGRDRIGARWVLARSTANGRLDQLSHFAYATDLSGASANPLAAVAMPKSKKGMGGVWANDILDELVELGVRHITANMAISSLFNLEETDGWNEFRHGGRSWWVNPRVIDGYDQLIRFATDHEIVVSAIILVPFGDGAFAKLLIHPEADRAGHYAMPDLATSDGALAYEAAIAFLAERYAQPEDPNGRITNWILHNEVDYGWEWTNMGRQPMPVYLATYIRSMRLVYCQARRFNPQARVFISLTHNWAVPDDPGWKFYSPKRMLELLAKFSRVEGDFEWGVAYHPYPQSLFRPDAWNDSIPTAGFETAMITPKNIQVLDQWMQMPEMRFHGEAVRGVILSEQGFHTDGYSDAAQRLQSAAFVYTWNKIRSLSTIEAFHNHRWIDHPAEGGLKLGIRTLPGAGRPFGEKKQAWEVFKKLETSAEAEVAEGLRDLIGK